MCHSMCDWDEYIVGWMDGLWDVLDGNLDGEDEMWHVNDCAKCDSCCHFGCTDAGEDCGKCPAETCDFGETTCYDPWRQECNPHCAGDTYMCHQTCYFYDPCHENCCDVNCEFHRCKPQCDEYDPCAPECRTEDSKCPDEVGPPPA